MPDKCVLSGYDTFIVELSIYREHSIDVAFSTQHSKSELVKEPVTIRQIVGPIILNFEHLDGNNYSISWVSKLTQVTTVIKKTDKDQFTIHREWKQKKHVQETLVEQSTTLKRALSYFLINTDTYKITKAIVEEAKGQVVDWIGQVECIRINSYPKASKVQNRIGLPVLIGENQEREGIVLKMLPPEHPDKRPLIEIKLTNGSRAGKTIRIPTNKVWIE